MCDELKKEIKQAKKLGRSARRKKENALRIHYYFIQIAHILRQLLEHGSLLLRNMKLKTKKEISQLIINHLFLHQTQILTI